MTLNCKAGDLAIVIRGSQRHSPHIGKIVRVIRQSGQHPKLGWIWFIELPRPLEVFAFKSNLDLIGSKGLQTQCDSPDAWLRPIRPDTEGLDDDTATPVSQPRVLEAA